MKMKKSIKTIFVLSFAALAFILPCQKAKATSVETQKKWSTKKSIVYTKKGIQFYSYISKNKKECWIYKIKLKSKKVTRHLGTVLLYMFTLSSDLDKEEVVKIAESIREKERD